MKTAIYNLRRRFGIKADIYHIVSVSDNSQTGRVTTARTKYANKSIVVLPNMLIRNSGPGYGMMPSTELDNQASQILIEKSQLPLGFLLFEKDYIITHEIIQRQLRQRRRYNIEKVEDIDRTSWLLTVKNAKGTQFNEIFDMAISESVTINHSSNNANEQSYLFPIELPMTLNW